MSTIEGEVIPPETDDNYSSDYSESITGAPEALPAVASEKTNQVRIFNPLDADPVAFKAKLVSRQNNYDELATFIRDMLVVDKDFGRIHHANKQKCPKPWHCSFESEPFHWSGYSLWAPGADKVLAMLGLATEYPGYQDYIRAAVTGKQINDIIIKCEVMTSTEVIANGMGAAARGDHGGSINTTLKIACKRARVDAVNRLPGVSALFEDDFLAQVAAQKRSNSTTARTQRPKTGQHGTGATLTHCPIGKEGGNMRGVAFTELEDSALSWLLKHVEDKPDIWNAAKREWDARTKNTTERGGPDEVPTAAVHPKAGADAKPDNVGSPAAAQSNDDWMAQYEGNEPDQEGPPAGMFEDLEDSEVWKK